MPLRRVARQRELELRTLQRWLCAYRQRGLARLARKARRDRGCRDLPAPPAGDRFAGTPAHGTPRMV
jgi:hypothetical protein